MQITKRKATSADIPFLLELRRSTMNTYLATSGMSISDEEHLQRIELAFEYAQILEVKDLRVGFLKVTRHCGLWKLIQIQLCPELQGAGTGAMLIRELQSEAKSLGVAIQLSVLKTNPARHLYERLGFIQNGEDQHSFSMIWQSATAPPISFNYSPAPR